jgi:hypothetical protein
MEIAMNLGNAGVRSRRAFLLGVLGAGVASVAEAIGRPMAARATDGDLMHVGDSLSATSSTHITNVTNLEPVLIAESSTGVALSARTLSGHGLYGFATRGTAVYAQSRLGTGLAATSEQGLGLGVASGQRALEASSSNGEAVFGDSVSSGKAAIVGRALNDMTGIYGYSSTYDFSHVGEPPLPPAQRLTGVYGRAEQGIASRGVWGESAEGQAVRGQTTTGRGIQGEATSGLGVRGHATTGTGGSFDVTAPTGHALRTSGRLSFAKVSGIADIPIGHRSVTIKPGVDVTWNSFVLLTPRSDLGSRRWWVTTNPDADAFTIHVSAMAIAVLRIGWLLVG